MSVEFWCPCGKQGKVKDSLAGKKIRCPECGEILSVTKQERSRNSPRKKKNRRSEVERQAFGGDSPTIPKPRRVKKRRTKKQAFPIRLIGVGVLLIGLVVGVAILAIKLGPAIAARFSGQPEIVQFHGFEFALPPSAEESHSFDEKMRHKGASIGQEYSKSWISPGPLTIVYYKYVPSAVLGPMGFAQTNDDAPIAGLLDAKTSAEALDAIRLRDFANVGSLSFTFSPISEEQIAGLPFAVRNFELHRSDDGAHLHGRVYCYRDGQEQWMMSYASEDGPDTEAMNEFINMCQNARRIE